MSRLGHVWLVGAGPGNPGWITVAGREALEQAEVVLYDRLAAAELLRLAPDGALLVDCGKASGRQALSQDETTALLIEHGRAGRRVVRLKGGDPYVFGRGGEEARALACAAIPCTVIPGVSSALAGLTAAGIPATDRGTAVSFAVVTGHEDPTKGRLQADWQRLARATDTLVVLMAVGRLRSIASQLIRDGRRPETPAAVIEQAATVRQRVVAAPLAEIARTAEEVEIRAPALLVVGEVAALREELDPRRLAPLAEKRVLVTRARQRASELVRLLRLEGAWPLELPTIETAEEADPEQVASAVHQLRAGRYAWVAFSSPVGVVTCLDLFSGAGADARAFAGTRIAAVGRATARALAARGLIADVVPDEATGEAAAEAIARAGALRNEPVLLPRAHRADPALATGLRAAGALVTELPLYLSRPVASPSSEVLAELSAGRVDVATFTSSSTVRNLAAVLGGDLSPLAGVTIACIGPTTARTASELGLSPDLVAPDHSVAGLVEALRVHFWSRADRAAGLEES